MLDEYTRVTRADGLRWRRDGPDLRHAAVLMPASGGIHMLSPVAADILESCDGRRSLGDILDSLVSEYAAPRDVIRADLIATVASLIDSGACRVEGGQSCSRP